MRGISGLIIILAVLYFTGAGGWLWNNVKQLDGTCYATLQRMGGSIATPVCDGLARGIAVIDGGLTQVSEKIEGWKQSVLGGTLDLNAMTSSLGDRFSQMASPSSTLNSMMHDGPWNVSGSARQSIQQAIDSFTIGQSFMKPGGDSSQAVEWFKHGAQQPQGYGLMSQLQLGNLYMNGQGVPQNNQAASAYLQQASNSITTLMQSNTPQSQQILSALPSSPEAVKAQLQATIRQLQIRK